MFCKQKGYLEEELDYRKQALDQAYMVRLCMSIMFNHSVGTKSECKDSITNWNQSPAKVSDLILRLRLSLWLWLESGHDYIKDWGLCK